MNKIAQRRGVFDKLREKTNVSGKLLESFSPEFAELMDNLREVDDTIRLEAAKLKDYLKAAKTNFNRREYMSAIYYLGNFHDRVEAINHELSKLGNNIDDKHVEFLFGDMDPEHLEYLTKYFNPKVEKFKTKQTAKAASNNQRTVLEKEAGLSDWWHNITTDRGKTLSSWEKRFPKYSKELKRQTSNMITRSETYLSILLSSLKRLASFRNTRKLEDYIREAEKLKSKFNAYNAQFINYYNNNVKRLVDNSAKAVVNLEDARDKSEFKELEEGQKKNIEELAQKYDIPVEKVDAIMPSKPIENARDPFPAPITEKYPHVSELETALTDPAPPGASSNEVKIPKAPKVPNIPSPSRQKTILPPSMDTGTQDAIEGFSDVPSSISPALPSVRPQQNRTHTLTGINPEMPPDRKTVPDFRKQEPPYGEVFPPQSTEVVSRPTLPSVKNAKDYQTFIDKISSLEQENPLLVAKEIIVYANSCEDLKTKNTLLQIARNMIG